MARLFNGSSDRLNGSGISALDDADAFTVCIRYKATTLNQGSADELLLNGTFGGYWDIQHTGTSVRFRAHGFTSDYDLTVPDATNWHTYIFRHKAGGEMAGWVDRSKTTHAGTLAETTGSLASTDMFVGYDGSSAWSDGALADIAVWNVALTDDIVDELGCGVSPKCFPTGRTVFFALNGNSSPEVDYVSGESLTVTGTTKVANPRRVPWKDRTTIEPVWLLNVTHSGTIRASTRDLYEIEDYDVLGGAYDACIANDFTLIESVPDGGGAVSFGQAVVEVETASGTFSVNTDYQGDKVSIWKYDRVSHAHTQEFVGYINHQTRGGPAKLRFDLKSGDPALRTLIPRQTIELHSDTIDTGVGIFNTSDSSLDPVETAYPYPIACGDGGMSVARKLRDIEDDDPAGQEYVIAWDDNTVVKAAWSDTDIDTPGLEKQVLWTDDMVGGPAYGSSSTFTVSITPESSFDIWYKTGYEVRQSVDSGSTWSEFKVTGLSWTGGTGTVTVSPAGLVDPGTLGGSSGDMGSGTSRFEVSTQLILSTSDWEYDNGSTQTPITTAIQPNAATPLGRIVTQLSTSDRTDPADLFQFIVEDDDQGLAGTLNSDDYTAASAAFATAGLDEAIATVMGGDGRRRTAQKWLDDICKIYGVRYWRDDSGEFRFVVDSQPSAASLAVGYGVNTSANQRNNLLRAPAYDTIPEDEKTAALRLHYAPGGRSRGSKPLVEEDYAYLAQMSVHNVGATRDIYTTLIRDHAAAARMLWYIGKRLEYGVDRAQFVTDHDGWRVQVGEFIDDEIKSETWRVLRAQKTLTTYSFGCVGHDSEIFETTIGTIRAEVAQPTGIANPNETDRVGINGDNVIKNPDFSTGLNEETLSTPNDDSILPGWLVGDSGEFSSIDVVVDPDTVGGSYLELVTDSSFSGDAPLIVSPEGVTAVQGYPCTVGQPMIASAYVNTTAASGSWSGLRFEIAWINSSDAYVGGAPVELDMHLRPGDVNAKGWRRIYGQAVAPAGALRCQLYIRTLLTSTTYQIDAVQFEDRLSLYPGPTPFKRSIQTGLKPKQMLAGTFSVRAEGSTVSGLEFSPDLQTVSSFTGTSMTLLTWPGGMWTDCAGRITTTIGLDGGGTKWDIRQGSTTGRILVADIGTTGTWDIEDSAIANPVVIPSGTSILAVPQSPASNFTSGAVKVTAVPYKTRVPEA